MQDRINDPFVDQSDFNNIAMPMHNLVEYRDNYFDTSGSLQQFKRDETATNTNVCNSNSFSFEYKSSIIGYVAADRKRKSKNSCTIKIIE